MDTRKLTVETYGCSCEGGVEYGLIIKDTDPAIMEGDDEVMSIVTHRRHMPEPETDEDAWNPYGQQDFTNELVKRWNAYPELLDRIHDLVLTASRVEDMMDGDKQNAWTEELGRLYIAINEATEVVNSLNQ